MDAIPDFIKNNTNFTKNELGKLGNIETLPTQNEIEAFEKQNYELDNNETAKNLLEKGQVKEAWLILLSQQKTEKQHE